MLSEDDIRELTAVLATKEDIALLEARTTALKDEAVQDLMASIEEGITEVSGEFESREAALIARIEQQEEWIRILAEKAGVTLPQA